MRRDASHASRRGARADGSRRPARPAISRPRTAEHLAGIQPFDLFRNTAWAMRLPALYRGALGREFAEAMGKDQPLDAKAGRRAGTSGLRDASCADISPMDRGDAAGAT